MAKHDAKGKSKTERYIRIPHGVYRTKAFKALSANAVRLLLDVWARYNGSNNGWISYAVREADEIGLSKDAASRAFAELREKGFLRVRREGAFHVKRLARTWELTMLPTDAGVAVRDYLQWSPKRSRKNRTQSHQRDRQSHQRDYRPLRVIK